MKATLNEFHVFIMLSKFLTQHDQCIHIIKLMNNHFIYYVSVISYICHSVFGDRKLINIRVCYQSLQDRDIDKQSTQNDEVIEKCDLIERFFFLFKLVIVSPSFTLTFTGQLLNDIVYLICSLRVNYYFQTSRKTFYKKLIKMWSMIYF